MGLCIKRTYRIGIFPEMHAVRADRKSPADIDAAVIRPVRVVLVAHTELTVDIHEAVRVVEPAAAGGEMYPLTSRLSVQIRIKLWPLLDLSAGDDPVKQCVRNVFVLTRERDGPARERVKIQWTIKIRFSLGQRQIKLGKLFPGRIVGDLHIPHAVGILDGAMEDRGGKGKRF